MSDRPPGWPPNVERMDLQSLKRLGTDATNRLYWDGKRITTRLTLSIPQTILAMLAALASIATIFTGLNNASIYLCARGVTLLGCPQVATVVPPIEVLPHVSPQTPGRTP